MKLGTMTASISATLAIATMLGCSGGDGSPQGAPVATKEDAAPAAKMTASAESKATAGVAAWEAYENSGVHTVLAKDEHGGLAWTLDVREGADPDHVNFSSSGESLTLARDGSIDGHASDTFRAVVARFYQDVEVPARDAAETVTSKVKPDTLQPNGIAYYGHVSLGWSVFGWSHDQPVGGACHNALQRTNLSTSVYDGTGSCWFKSWSNNNTYDCTAVLHTGQHAFDSAECDWYIYQWYDTGY